MPSFYVSFLGVLTSITQSSFSESRAWERSGKSMAQRWRKGNLCTVLSGFIPEIFPLLNWDINSPGFPQSFPPPTAFSSTFSVNLQLQHKAVEWKHPEKAFMERERETLCPNLAMYLKIQGYVSGAILQPTWVRGWTNSWSSLRRSWPTLQMI